MSAPPPVAPLSQEECDSLASLQHTLTPLEARLLVTVRAREAQLEIARAAGDRVAEHGRQLRALQAERDEAMRGKVEAVMRLAQINTAGLAATEMEGAGWGDDDVREFRALTDALRRVHDPINPALAARIALQHQRQKMATLVGNRDRLRALVGQLVGYLQRRGHSFVCAKVQGFSENPCNCGQDAVLAEAEQEVSRG